MINLKQIFPFPVIKKISDAKYRVNRIDKRYFLHPPGENKTACAALLAAKKEIVVRFACFLARGG